MKNVKNIFRLIIIAMGFVFMHGTMKAQTIPNNFFGQNAWMPDTIGSVYYGGKLHQQWGKVRDSRAVMIRFGGIAADNNMPTNYQYIKMIDSVRAKGMEPIIQVSFHKYKYTAQQAAALVQYINGTKQRNVKYWSIGNEPDLEYGYTTSSQVAAYIKPFASAMKTADPSIIISAPECAWFNRGIIDGLTSPGGADDITGKDANGRYYVDVISFHTYPFSGTQTRTDAIGKLYAANQLQENLVYLNNRIASCNSAHARTGGYALRTAVTEANIDYQNPAGDNLYTLGVNSFFGGQFMAEMFGVGMKNGVSYMNIWSVAEGNGIGYIDHATGAKKPAYYHYKMMAEHFKGNTYVSSASNQGNVKVFACQNTQNITVMIMNQDAGVNYNFTMKLNNDVVGGNGQLKINVNANAGGEYSDVVQNQSTMILVFTPDGSLVKKVLYTLQNHAANSLAPTVTEFSASGPVTSTDDQPADDEVSMKGFSMNVFPNPANSRFTIELDRNNKYEVKFRVEIYDILGRLIQSVGSVFPGRQQKIDLTGQSVAEAVYIVKVREEGDKDNWKSAKVVVFK
jgi:hypothetical protein